MSNGYGKQNIGFGISRDQSVDLIVKTCLDNNVTDTRQIAYVLATAQHETQNFTAPDEEWGRKQALEMRYSGGEEYRGRGYVHLTHEQNYQALGDSLGLGRELHDNPSRAAEPEIAARVMVLGMREGDFGARLDRHINARGADYRAARASVNGAELTNGSPAPDRIAGYARDWELQVPALVERVRGAGIDLTPLPPQAPDTPGLGLGHSNQDVFEAQQYLARLGITNTRGEALCPDGDFGPSTEQAVNRYQQQKSLPQTGQIDEALFRQLRDDTLALDPQFKRRSYTDVHGPLADGALKPGEQGEPVYELRIQLEATGYLTRDPKISQRNLRTYDEDMQAAMRKFQGDEKLPIDPHGEVLQPARRALNTRATQAGAAPTTEFDRDENWPSQRPPYTRVEFQQPVRDHAQTEQAPARAPAAPAPAPHAPAEPQHAPAGPRRTGSLTDPSHLAHPEFQRLLREVHSMEFRQGMAHGPHSEKVAAALLTQATRDGLHPNRVEMSADGQILGIERRSAFETPRSVSIDPRQAQGPSMEEHSAQWARAFSPHLVSQAPAAMRSASQAKGLEDLSHADQGMFARIRRDVPAHIGDDHVMQAMLDAKRADMGDANQISRVAVAGDNIWVVGSREGYRSQTDLNATAPALQNAVQQVQSLNQQREQQVAIDMAPRLDGPGGRGAPSMA